MKILRNYLVAGALYVNDTGAEAQVSDQVTLFLDTDAEPGFPESIVATIQHPITRVECGTVTSYIFEYDEADLDGAAVLLRPQDVINATVVSGVLVVANELDDEIARAIAAELVLTNNLAAEITNRIADVNAEETRALAAELVLTNNLSAEIANRVADVNAEEARALAAEALLAPKASPTFTGIVTLPTTTTIGTVSDVEIGYLDGVTSAIQTQLGTRAPSASPTFTGVVTLGDAVDVVLNATTGTKIGTATTQKLAFHNSTPVVQRAGAAQVAVVTTASSLAAYGYTQAQADSIVTLLNELRAALVEKGIIKGAA